jgi:hypothetical protein
MNAFLLRSTALVAAAMGVAPPAGAVLTFTPMTTARQVILQVGSANGTVNNVTFNVSNANVAPTPVAVIGTPGNGTPATAPANGTEIRLTARIPAGQTRNVTLTVDSSAGLACVAGTGCGATVIPFSTISWTSYNKEVGTYAGVDIQDGTFSAGAGQLLASGSVTTGGFGLDVVMSNVLIFSYANTTLYPSGQYLGRVVYTAANV